jgi:hypothetical protein
MKKYIYRGIFCFLLLAILDMCFGYKILEPLFFFMAFIGMALFNFPFILACFLNFLLFIVCPILILYFFFSKWLLLEIPDQENTYRKKLHILIICVTVIPTTLMLINYFGEIRDYKSWGDPV